jgi:hypothetical protein
MNPDSGFKIPDSRFQIFQIPDIPDSRFKIFKIPNCRIQIPES